jgi:hypothetical protein
MSVSAFTTPYSTLEMELLFFFRIVPCGIAVGDISELDGGTFLFPECPSECVIARSDVLALVLGHKSKARCPHRTVRAADLTHDMIGPEIFLAGWAIPSPHALLIRLNVGNYGWFGVYRLHAYSGRRNLAQQMLPINADGHNIHRPKSGTTDGNLHGNAPAGLI